jgi:hypothetical protein
LSLQAKEGQLEAAATMSALGQKRTLGRLSAMSALPPKADIGSAHWDVRFVPKADIGVFAGMSSWGADDWNVKNF